MKIAITYDHLLARGGTERTISVLAKELKADVWTTEYRPEKTYPEYKKLRVFSHSLSSYPLTGAWQLEAALRFRNMDLSDYDLRISAGYWGRHIAIKEKNHPLFHLELLPIRVFYDKYDYTKKMLPFFPRQLFKVWVWYMKKLDQEAVAHIERCTVQSKTGQERVKKYYRCSSEVVYPPIDIEKFRYRRPEDYFLSVQRVDPEKRLEIQIGAFKKLPDERLLVVGEPTKRARIYFDEIKKMAPQNVEFIELVSDKELVDLYSRCKAVIQTSLDEDFGIVPVEAMASGKPCIAVNEGGFRETVFHGKTGLLINPPYVQSLVKAIQRFDKYDFDPKICRARAKTFSKERWLAQIRKIISEMLGS
jgi:glycosyltransferase involved in cell wall biosynthesis